MAVHPAYFHFLFVAFSTLSGTFLFLFDCFCLFVCFFVCFFVCLFLSFFLCLLVFLLPDDSVSGSVFEFDFKETQVTVLEF